MKTLLRPYEGTQPYIFVSYAHKNDAAVLEIIGTLQSRGFRVWYDEGIEAGSEWPESIASHLERAQLVLAFLSPAYLQSDNCRKEMHYALTKKKPVIIHFLGDERPWIGGNHNHYGKWYRKYLDMTPWKDMPMQKGKFWYMQLWWCFNQMTRLCPALRLAISRRLGMKVIDNRKKSQGK